MEATETTGNRDSTEAVYAAVVAALPEGAIVDIRRFECFGFEFSRSGKPTYRYRQYVHVQGFGDMITVNAVDVDRAIVELKIEIAARAAYAEFRKSGGHDRREVSALLAGETAGGQ